jgi:hypothetical protein
MGGPGVNVTARVLARHAQKLQINGTKVLQSVDAKVP